MPRRITDAALAFVEDQGSLARKDKALTAYSESLSRRIAIALGPVSVGADNENFGKAAMA
jgi:hypothetical protein